MLFCLILSVFLLVRNNSPADKGSVKYSRKVLIALKMCALNLHGVSKKSKMRDQNQSAQCAHWLEAKYFLVSNHGI